MYQGIKKEPMLEYSDFCQECSSSSTSSSSCPPNDSSNSSSTGSSNNADSSASSDLTIKFRPLQECDHDEIKLLHEELFPVRYSPQFYNNVILNQTSGGKPLYSSIAVIQHNDDDEESMNHHYPSDPASLSCGMYKKLALCVGIEGFKEEGFHQSWRISDPHITNELKQLRTRSGSHVARDQIVGCIIGSFVEADQAKEATSSLLVRDPQTHGNMFYIMTLGATEKFRNKGLGKKLVQDCIEMVEQVDSCGVIYLHVITYNQAAIRFYERLGFYRMDEIQDYYKIDGVKHSCYLYAYFLHGNRRSLLDIIYSAYNRVVTGLRSAIPY